MKKIVVIFVVLILCLCGCGTNDIMATEELVFPEIPTQMAAADLPTVPQGDTDMKEETAEAEKPAGEAYPWDKEFPEADYKIHKEIFGGGRAFAWMKDYEKGRQVIYYNNGDVEDTYYYPSGFMSHQYWWGADGSYTEFHWLDNGYIETKENGTQVSHLGTTVYCKQIAADGSWYEIYRNAEDIQVLDIYQYSDGRYQENRYYETGELSQCISHDPTAETYREEWYDKEGFLTYYCVKGAEYELELISDESGKLVEAVENGQPMEDPDALAKFAGDYNFRS